MTSPLRLYVANLPHRKLANAGILLPLQPMRQDAPRVLAPVAGAIRDAIRMVGESPKDRPARSQEGRAPGFHANCDKRLKSKEKGWKLLVYLRAEPAQRL